MKIVFMGTSPFAATILRKLSAWQHADITCVYCRPDKPAGRGHRLVPPPVKECALELGLRVAQPANFKNETDIDALRAEQPDVLVVASYGLILPQAVLDIPAIAPINVHASLLPRYRGAAPIERVVMDGCTQTGISIMKMEAGLDTGPILSQRALGIGIDETAGELHDQLADLGAHLLIEVLEAAVAGHFPNAIPQVDERATYAAKITREDALLDWNTPAIALNAILRGVTPRPGGRTVFDIDGKQVAARVVPARAGALFREPFPEGEHPAPGTVAGLVRCSLAVACADAYLLLGGICPAGKAIMEAKAFANGYLKNAVRVVAVKPEA